MSNLKAYVFLLLSTILLIVLGDLIAGYPGIYFAILIAVLINAFAFLTTDKVALNIFHAKEMSSEDPHDLRATIKSLADKGNVPMPQIYLITSNACNLFVTGRNHHCANIAVTTGLLNLLTQDELTAVLAQMVAQISHRTIFLNTMIATIAGSISGLATVSLSEVIFDEKNNNKECKVNHVLMAIFGPIAALLIRSVIYPGAQFEADQTAVKWCGNSTGLISALEKMETSKIETPFQLADARPAMAHLFLINPIRNQRLARLFQTQPPTAKRTARLK